MGRYMNSRLSRTRGGTHWSRMYWILTDVLRDTLMADSVAGGVSRPSCVLRLGREHLLRRRLDVESQCLYQHLNTGNERRDGKNDGPGGCGGRSEGVRYRPGADERAESNQEQPREQQQGYGRERPQHILPPHAPPKPFEQHRQQSRSGGSEANGGFFVSISCRNRDVGDPHIQDVQPDQDVVLELISLAQSIQGQAPENV